jgi:PTH1 family peptidyl-tRNA hydrolase
MILIVGLGNPGEKYIGTKHNLGFMAIDCFLKDFSGALNNGWEKDEKFKSDVVHIEWKPKVGPLKPLILAKPRTYMNNSGLAVRLISQYYKIPAENIWIIYDDLDLPVGGMKIRFGGAAAGHHGAESIMDGLGTDKFWRFRLGIGYTHVRKDPDTQGGLVGKHIYTDAQDYVLSPFSGSEKGKVRELIKHGSEAMQLALEKDMESAMNRYNTK